jgi:zinc transporter
MKVSRYALIAGKVQELPVPENMLAADLGGPGQTWYDVGEVEPEGLRQFLAPLALHPLILDRCLRPASDPSVLSIERATLLAFPTATDRTNLNPTYVTILLQAPLLVTIRHSPLPVLDDLVQEFLEGKMPDVQHLPQLVYLILDDLSDVNVNAGMDVRGQIAALAQVLAEKPDTVTAGDLSRLRGQVEGLVSLVENQLYCIAGLSASDNEALEEPHRKAYIQDLAAEAEIAQRSAYRLESRMNDLFAMYQMAGSDRVEKRLRILTIISATTLPLALITGVLGMNVGGVPGTDSPYGFLVVIVLMLAIAAAELWYFVRRGWFG